MPDDDLHTLDFKRHLILELDDSTGDITWDDSAFTPFEILGISEAWFNKIRAELFIDE